jgi:hypothetical protein
MFNPLEPLSTIYARIHDSVEKWNEPAQVANQITNRPPAKVLFSYLMIA